MKSMKKLVLAGLVLLVSVMVLLPLVGCKNDSVPEVPKYTVKFETEHWTAPASITVESGTKLTTEQLKALADTEDNIFEGWYDGETQAKGGEYTVTKDVTLVARWRNRDTVASVTFSPSDTKFYYDEKVTVTLSSNTEGATIQYKLNSGDWRDYSKEITVTSDTTITAKATKEGLKDSKETSATYTVRKLTSITVTPPSRTVYSVGESFDSTGMEVTAEYDDGEIREVNTWTTDFDKITSEKGLNKTVTVSYTEGEKPVTATFTVVVFPEEVKVLTDYESPNNTYDSCTYVAFGEWPQSEAIGVSPTKVEQQPEGLFNEKYYSDSNGNYVKEGDKYYKVEPIVWRVLTENYLVPGENGQPVESGNSLLLAEKILTGGIPYYVNTSSRTIGSATVYANNYKYSTIRAWLNGSYETKDTQETNYEGKGFLQTAFTEEAQKLIESTKVDNSARSTNPNSDASKWNSGNNEYACENTSDKIFLLSEQEATTASYGFDVYDAFGAGSTRIRVTTDYAKATGAHQSGTVGYGGWWWLRSPGYGYEYNARNVGSFGSANNYSSVDYMEMGVVPALCIKLQ